MFDKRPESAFWLTEYNTPHDAYCHGIVKVLHQQKTDYQQMMIVDGGTYGKALILDGKWQASTVDEFLYHEPLVHPACVIQGGPERVLILGGGDGATLREVLKWSTVNEAVMVDLDGEVVQACHQLLPEMHQGAFDDHRARVLIEDGFEFLQKNDRNWDVIISDLTDPLENGPSYKLFTRDYFEICRKALSPGGCFVLQAGVAGPADMDIHVRLARTVATVFKHMFHFTSHVPTWASPMGFVLGTDHESSMTNPDPEQVDLLLKNRTTGNFKMFDGRTMLHLMHPPKYIRQAIAEEQQIYTLDDPPKDF